MSKLPLTVLAVTIISGAFVCSAIAADIGISIHIGEPGFYGRLDMGDFPQPSVIHDQPLLIERTPGYRSQEPIYLRVPPGQEEHWRKYCAHYDACGQPVYYVRDRWYQQTYAPHYREHKRGSRQDNHQENDWREHPGDHRREHHDDNHD